MPAPKAKEEGKKGHKKQTTVYDENGHWVTFQKQDELRAAQNPLFETYYRDLQQITGGDHGAFAEFVKTLRTPLETTIWINDCDPYAQEVSNYFASLPETLASPIPWYPIKGMGWRIHTDKVQLRKDPQNKVLRQFMIKQTAMGTVSRQEEVSMIPPFLLDIQPDDMCLDMCASPGSKTAQMMVALGRHKRAAALANGSPFPYDYLSDGFVVANELDTSRANMLVHQVKRLRLLFPFALFSNHDARFFPELGTTEAPVKFDKILCDVVCSGDGTIRKSPFIFKIWTPREATKLQKTQVLIAMRACYLLKVGGRMVYSTCSLNPIENEAVVAQILHRTNGAIKLVDGRSMLPNLQCDKGLTTWKVTDNKGNILDGPNENFHEALWPLADPPADMDLTKCMRLMPNHCQGGGFFIAVFEKVAEITHLKGDLKGKGAPKSPVDETPTGDVDETEDASAEAVPEKKARKEKPKKEGEESKVPAALRLPPQFVVPAAAQTESIPKFFGLQNFPLQNLLVRTPPGEREVRADPTSNVIMVSNGVLKVLQSKSDKVRIVSAGLRTLAAENLNGGWRISYEASSLFQKFFEKNDTRMLTVDRQLVIDLMVGGKLKELPFGDLPDALREKVVALELGSLLYKIMLGDTKGSFVTAVGLRARGRLQLLVDHEDIVELQLRMGVTEEELKAATDRYTARIAREEAERAAQATSAPEQ